LLLEFTGSLGEQAQGLFYAKYHTVSGQKLMLCTANGAGGCAADVSLLG
jgi:hypothetical protein